MGRPAGSRNRDYESTRHALAARMAPHLVRDDGEPASLTDLAAAAGVSTTTLKHYFVDRDGVFEAVTAAVLANGRVHLEAVQRLRGLDPADSVPTLLLRTVEAWRQYGLGRVFASSLSLGLEHASRGPAFLTGILEPFLESAEWLLRAHVEDGGLPEIDARAVALGLVAPVVLALLHQDHLGGHATRHLGVEDFAAQHAQTMLAGVLSTARPGGSAAARQPTSSASPR
jgi:AcrR family transcriptional regulator